MARGGRSNVLMKLLPLSVGNDVLSVGGSNRPDATDGQSLSKIDSMWCMERK